MPLKDTRSRPILIVGIGNVPPPITGKTLVTKLVFGHLKVSLPSGVLVFSPRLDGGRLGNIVRKCAANMRGLASAIWAALSGTPVHAYIVADAGNGVFLTAVFACLFRLFVKKLAVHHHGAIWMSKRSHILRALLFTSSTTQVVQCQTMGEMLRSCYPHVKYQVLSNAFMVREESFKARFVHSFGERSFRLGHLSNLTLEKGLGRAIEAFELLKTRGLDVNLRIGGPPASDAAKVRLENALKDHPEIEYVPYVSDEMKADFFADMDVFLFASLYPIESQAIVTLEALAMGVPVIAYPRCCLKETLRAGGGVAVEERHNFAETACAVIERWIRNPDAHEKARSDAFRRFKLLRKKALSESEQLFTWICSPAE